MGGTASLHYTLISEVGAWDANYASSPLQVTRYAGVWNVRPSGRAQSRWVSGNLYYAGKVVLYTFYLGKGFHISISTVFLCSCVCM